MIASKHINLWQTGFDGVQARHAFVLMPFLFRYYEKSIGCDSLATGLRIRGVLSSSPSADKTIGEGARTSSEYCLSKPHIGLCDEMVTHPGVDPVVRPPLDPERDKADKKTRRQLQLCLSTAWEHVPTLWQNIFHAVCILVKARE